MDGDTRSLVGAWAEMREQRLLALSQMRRGLNMLTKRGLTFAFHRWANKAALGMNNPSLPSEPLSAPETLRSSWR